MTVYHLFDARRYRVSFAGVTNIVNVRFPNADLYVDMATLHVMPKSDIKIVEDTPGTGPELKKGDRVRLRYDIQLNRGDFLARDRDEIWTVGDREAVAGFRYGLEGMRAGGSRRFRASPHLCYRGEELASIPKNAVLIFDIKYVEIVA